MDGFWTFAQTHTFEFLIICAVLIFAIERAFVAWAHRQRPIVQKIECDCACCGCDEEDEDE